MIELGIVLLVIGILAMIFGAGDVETVGKVAAVLGLILAVIGALVGADLGLGD